MLSARRDRDQNVATVNHSKVLFIQNHSLKLDYDRLAKPELSFQ